MIASWDEWLSSRVRFHYNITMPDCFQWEQVFCTFARRSRPGAAVPSSLDLIRYSSSLDSEQVPHPHPHLIYSIQTCWYRHTAIAGAGWKERGIKLWKIKEIKWNHRQEKDGRGLFVCIVTDCALCVCVRACVFAHCIRAHFLFPLPTFRFPSRQPGASR